MDTIEELMDGKSSPAVLAGLAAGAAATSMRTSMPAPGVMSITRKRIPKWVGTVVVVALAIVLVGAGLLALSDDESGGGNGLLFLLLVLLLLFVRETETISVTVADVAGGARVVANGTARPDTWAAVREWVAAIKAA